MNPVNSVNSAPSRSAPITLRSDAGRSDRATNRDPEVQDDLRSEIVRLGRDLQEATMAARRAGRTRAALDQLASELARAIASSEKNSHDELAMQTTIEAVKEVQVDGEPLLDGAFAIEAGPDRFVLDAIGMGSFDSQPARATLESLTERIASLRKRLERFRSERVGARMRELSVRLGILMAANAGPHDSDSEKTRLVREAARTVMAGGDRLIGSVIDTRA
jgi:hypothetical protein